MEKTFRRMVERPSARHAYVTAEVTTALAHQVRALRLQRGWTQRQLAVHLRTTQAAVSRIEDPSYGKIALSTLFELSKVFDTGLQVRFVSLVGMLRDTWLPSPASLEVPTFEEQSATVGFYESLTSARPTATTMIVAGSSQLLLSATTARTWFHDPRSMPLATSDHEK